MEPIALPYFRCHKRVQAVKIKDVQLHDPAGSDPPVPFAGGYIMHDLPNLGPIPFDAAFWEKHHPAAGEYYVVYEDGYKSVSPPKPFEDGYMIESTGVCFGAAIEALKAGKRVCRANWEGKGLFVFMQVPARIPADIVPKMQSLPDAVKTEFARRGQDLRYSNQLALVKPDGQINGWAPSTSDALAEDWQIHELSGVKAPELPPHQQRVIAEKAELDDRLKKLGVFIKESPVFLKLPEDEKTRQMRQHNCMSEYALILTARIEAF